MSDLERELDVDAETRAVLDRFGFDEAAFAELRERVRTGVLSPEGNFVRGKLEPPAEADLVPLPERSKDGEARAAGVEALTAGHVATVILNGGMATRFGGVVKGIVEVFDGRSFLELKLASATQVAESLGAAVPVAVMTSFATDARTREFVAETRLPEPLWFSQFVSLRLERDGELFRGGDGQPSPYAPGHGDFLVAIRRSGVLERLREAGVRHVMVSNVDNLGARIDPAVVGMHLLGGRPVTAEVAAKGGDLGGAPVRLDGRPQLLEAPRFPPSFDQGRIPVFNVNTVTLDLDVLDSDYDLTWLYVEKSVDGRTAVQLERVFHEVTASVPTTFLVVPRGGPRGRFFPIKTPEDLEATRGDLRELLATSPLA